MSDIGRSLHTSVGATSWVITANLLAAAVSTPLLGRLGDLRGRRPVLQRVLPQLPSVVPRACDVALHGATGLTDGAQGPAWPFGAKWSGLLLRKWSARVGRRAHTVGFLRI
ncbi:hypothetical protein ACWDA7_44825 [Streptomyces sp. NPDC001156]